MSCTVAVAVARRSRPLGVGTVDVCEGRRVATRRSHIPLSAATAPATPLQVESIAELEGVEMAVVAVVVVVAAVKTAEAVVLFPFISPLPSAVGRRLSVVDRAATPFGHTQPLCTRTPSLHLG